MRPWFFIFLQFSLLALGQSQSVDVNEAIFGLPCPLGWSYFPPAKSCYYVGGVNNNNLDVNYKQASEKCRQLNSQLVSIHSKYENDFVFELLPRSVACYATWIGLVGNGNGWEWEDGTPYNYFNYYTGADLYQKGMAVFMDSGGTEGGCMVSSQWEAHIQSGAHVKHFVCKRKQNKI